MPHVECWVDGVWMPSVTTILDVVPKPWLNAWREKWGTLAVRKMAIAAAIGTEVHRCIEEYINTGAYVVNVAEYPSCNPRTEGMLRSFVQWAKNIDGEVHAMELKVVSKKHKYSGTLDSIITLRTQRANP